jgi:hypothetical protein
MARISYLEAYRAWRLVGHCQTVMVVRLYLRSGPASRPHSKEWYEGPGLLA